MQKPEKAIVLSRTMYCESCKKAGRPRLGEQFLVFGGTSQKLYLHKAEHTAPFGFTPHIISFEGFLKDGRAKLIVSCGMIGCDTDIDEVFLDKHGKRVDEDDDSAVKMDKMPIFLKSRIIYMEALEYAALKKFKDSGYKL